MSIAAAINDFCDRLRIEGVEPPTQITLRQPTYERLAWEAFDEFGVGQDAGPTGPIRMNCSGHQLNVKGDGAREKVTT